jgi:hypothetical protein
MILIGIGVIGLLWYTYVKTYKPPTCYDGDRNQGELGKDCGGPCRLLCPFQTEDMEVEWTNLFEIAPDSWTAAAYVQNKNADAFTREAKYRFTFYDSIGRMIGTREGSTFVGGEPSLLVLESRIDGTVNEPYRVTFEWVGKPVYYKADRVKDVLIEQHEILPATVGSEVRAVLANRQPVAAEDVEVALIAYDADQNAMAVSTTYVDFLAPRSTRAISFSWPTGFAERPSRIEFITRVPVE